MKGNTVKLKEVENVERAIFAGADAFDLFHKLFYHGQTGAALTDKNGKIILSNPHFVKLVVQAPVALDLSQIIDQCQSENAVSEALVDAGPFTLKITLVPLPQAPHQVRWLWTVTAERENKEQKKLITLKNLYRSFVDNTFELVFRTSSSDHLVFSNRLFIMSFGFESYQHAKGQSALMVFEETARYFEIKERVLLLRKINHEVVHFRRADGERLTGLVNCQAHNDENGVPMLNWTVLNISERVEFEQRLQRNNEQLAKVNNQMEKFLYSTSHDLRSPITTIMGLVNLLRIETTDKVVLDYVSKVETSAMKLDKIIRDIMTFSRATYQRIKSERIDFEPMIWRVVNNYRNDPGFRKIHIEVNVKDEHPFYNDNDRLEIVIDNIVRNSFQFFDQNKARPFIHVNVSFDDSNVRIEFIDNGIGIGQQHMESVFNMFYKATHLSKGAGLGLFMVKEAVNQLHGSIQVESEIGFGSVFRVTIPNDHKGKLINRKLQLQQS